MEPIIKKAIEGGYKTPNYGEPVLYINARRHGKATAERMYECYVLADPLFWQALGKACGWSDRAEEQGMWEDGAIPYWEHTALKFHQINLGAGWDKAVSYLEELVK